MCARIFRHLSLISAEKITFLFSRSVVGVEDYESILTVQPATSSDQMGLEFALSGFENPGVKLPESVITWVAIRGMPEFMGNLRSVFYDYLSLVAFCTVYKTQQTT